MANTASAAKRARQTIVRTSENRRVTSALKKQLKVTRQSLKGGAKDAAGTEVQKLASLADKAAKTGRIHPNKANRLKSRAAKALAAVSK